MANIYVFADETGDLGYNLTGGSKFFGFGTATFTDSTPPNFESAFKLRCEFELMGFGIKEGFHATNDRWSIRNEIFQLIKSQPPRFDFTFLNKENAFPYVKEQGALRLYGLAWWMHFKDIAEQVTDRKIVPIIWNSRTSWGLQVADYGLWEAQRRINGEKTEWWEQCIAPNHHSFFRPWN
jgi:hypothetical protein